MCTKVDKYTARQFFILTASCLTSFSSGMALAFPAVLNPSILAPNATIHATTDQASWIAASHGMSGTFGFFILSPLFQMVGRKYVNLGISVIQLTGWIIFIFANSIFSLFFARIVQGIMVGGYLITAITVAEMCNPIRRGYFLTLKKIMLATGTLICHSLAFFMNWRQISAVATAPLIISAVMIIFWPESPSFLAMKGRFDDCKKSFAWVYGNSALAQKQMQELIIAQTERIKMQKDTSLFFVSKLVKKTFRRDFLKPLFVTVLLAVAIDASGRFFLLAYLPQIIVEITGDKSFAMYCTIASDCLLICALCISCYLIKVFKRRTMLLTFGAFSTALMFLVSLALVLKSHCNIGTEVRWLVPLVIIMHGFVSHIGLVPTSFAISAEVFPLEHKGMGCFASGIVFTSFYAITIKLTPIMIEHTSVAGTYAIFGLCVSVCLLLLCIILPETKDKTLQQIEDEIKGTERTLDNDVLIDNVRNSQ